MSKTIEDYREIVKVLKLQLLKIRQQNKSLSKTLGVAAETDTSSFTPRLQKLKDNKKQFAQHLYRFNYFAHKCELIGVTPEMVFRVADKKRDKKVSVADLTEIMKRLKLKLDDVEISRFLGSITKSNNIFYDEYLQYINAFQINSQTYPLKSQRTYSQICLLKLGDYLKSKQMSSQNLFREIANREGSPYISFQAFTGYCRSNTNLKDQQIISIFVTLDAQTDCQVQRQTFVRQINKIVYLIEKGASYEDSFNKDESEKYSNTEEKQKLPKGRRGNKQKEKEDFQYEQQTGVQKGVKKKEGKKQTKIKGDLNQIILSLKKYGMSVNTIIKALLEKQEKRKLIRPFNLASFGKAIEQINKKLQKKQILAFYKSLDTSGNGSISTDELVKLWLEGKDISDSNQILYKLLARYLKQIQADSPITKFTSLGYQKNDILNYNIFEQVFGELGLGADYLRAIVENNLPSKCTISKFVDLLESGDTNPKGKTFQPMKKIDFENMNSVIKNLIPKEDKRFPKLTMQQKSQNKIYWETIFTDEWTCWNYCLQTAFKLTSFWRDPQFGPSTGDPHGYRSIVGNESEPPAGLPFQDQITWLTFEQMLEKQNRKQQQVKLFSQNLVANDIMQGKLGDCWLVSALSIITADDELVKGKTIDKNKKSSDSNMTNLSYGIHPIMFHLFEKYGLYVFKFYKSFKPVYVVVDELFPVQISNNQLIFAKSPDLGLQWVAFVEKAYAKLHHSYSNLISGDISQGLSDLTNSLPIKQNLVNNNPEQLVKKFIKLTKERQLMGCSISAPPNSGVEQPVTLDDERTGLFYGHAYSIGDFIELTINQKNEKQDFKLVRVRNPWGHSEWMLDWSDKPLNSDPDYMKLDKYQAYIDKFYEEKIKIAMKMRENVSEIQKYKRGEDGEFLMSFYDFARIYSNLFIGFNFKQSEYYCQNFEGKWDKSMPSGLCKVKGSTQADKTKFVKDNYQFVFQVKEKTDILMFLIQQDGRLFRGEKYPYKEICNGIIILCFNLESNQRMLQKFDNSKMTLPNLKLQLKRETNYWHKFQPGKYAIIPSKMQNKIQQTDFELRIYSQKSISLRKVNGPSGEFKQVVKENKVDKRIIEGYNLMVDLVTKK